jgi:rhamnosyltransferase
MKKFAVVVPVLNAELYFNEFLPALSAQTVKPDRLLILDSESTDNTVKIAREFGAELFTIKRADFNHGGTRMVGVDLLGDCEIVVFLTQDAILADRHAIEKLVLNFDDEHVDLAYGRQLPRRQAKAIETFARLFNYPEHSEDRSARDIPRIGFKVCFCSNSFAAYRISRLLAVGGFPRDTIFGEDALVAAQLILSGSTIRYDAAARVFHSHAYSLLEEFRRYFDIGVMHNRATSLLGQFGAASAAGWRFLIGEIRYLLRESPQLVPEAILRTIIKFAAYNIGRREQFFPNSINQRLSMHRKFWIKSV